MKEEECECSRPMGDIRKKMVTTHSKEFKYQWNSEVQ